MLHPDFQNTSCKTRCHIVNKGHDKIEKRVAHSFESIKNGTFLFFKVCIALRCLRQLTTYSKYREARGHITAMVFAMEYKIYLAHALDTNGYRETTKIHI